MKFILNRLLQGDKGTNGQLTYNGVPICYTIERPWLDNQRRISCIPADTYIITKRYSKKFGWHLLVNNVPNRSLILFHPANNAIKELLGCIAPVSELKGLGMGINSKAASKRFFDLVFAAIERGETVTVTIIDPPKPKTNDDQTNQNDANRINPLIHSDGKPGAVAEKV